MLVIFMTYNIFVRFLILAGRKVFNLNSSRFLTTTDIYFVIFILELLLLNMRFELFYFIFKRKPFEQIGNRNNRNGSMHIYRAIAALHDFYFIFIKIISIILL